MNIWFLGFVAALMASEAAPAAGLAIGDTLPTLRGEFLSGRPAVLPQASSGRVALLLLGFTYDSRFAVEAWTRRFRQEFDQQPKVTFYEIPMIGGIARLGKWFIDSGMRRGTPKADHENVITVYGGTDSWKQRVSYGDPGAAYLILIDRNGKVVWRHSGAFDEEQYKSLSSEISNLLTAGEPHGS